MSAMRWRNAAAYEAAGPCSCWSLHSVASTGRVWQGSSKHAENARRKVFLSVNTQLSCSSTGEAQSSAFPASKLITSPTLAWLVEKKRGNWFRNPLNLWRFPSKHLGSGTAGPCSEGSDPTQAWSTDLCIYAALSFHSILPSGLGDCLLRWSSKNSLMAQESLAVWLDCSYTAWEHKGTPRLGQKQRICTWPVLSYYGSQRSVGFRDRTVPCSERVCRKLHYARKEFKKNS